MKTKILIILLLTFVFFTNSNFAQSQLEMNQTALKSYEKSNKELNKVYSILIKSLDKTEKQKLITTQKLWITFRDSHCEFESLPNEGGSIKPLIYSTCLKELTKKRTAELKQSIENRNN